MTNVSTTAVQFLQPHSVNFYDFPGAANFQGGYLATEVAAFPSDVAAALIASGVAQAAPAPSAAPVPPAMVKLRVQKSFSFRQCDYLPGDAAGFPEPDANRLVAGGFATIAA